MTHEEFTKQILRLKNQYGEKAYSEERCRVLWKEFGMADAHGFSQWVDWCLMNKRGAPTGIDMYEAKDACTTKYTYTGGTKCEKCENSGWSDNYEHMDTLVIVAERCSCMGGPERLAAFVQEKDPTLAEGIRKTFSEAGRARLRRLTKSEIEKERDRQASNVKNN